MKHLKTFELFEKKKSERPDFLDLDKDGDKEESMKKASKDKEEKGTSDKQKKKLSPALLKSIESKKKKK